MVSAAIADVAWRGARPAAAWRPTRRCWLAGLVPPGAGMGAAMTPATAAITEALPAAAQGVGSAVNDLARELDGAVGIAVIGSALTATYRSHLSLPGLSAAAVRQARDSFRRRRTPRRPGRGSRRAFTDGRRIALLVGTDSVLLAAIVVALLLRRETASPGPAPHTRRPGHRSLVPEPCPARRAART